MVQIKTLKSASEVNWPLAALISTGWILICDTACSRRSGVPFNSFLTSMLVSLDGSRFSDWSRTSDSILTSWISLGSFVSSTERKLINEKRFQS